MTFTGPTIEKPADMSLLAELSWIYFGFERRHEWMATRCGAGEILITDESGDLSGATVFLEEDEFVRWLEEQAEERIKDEPRNALSCILPDPFLTDDCIAAILLAIDHDTERRKNV